MLSLIYLARTLTLQINYILFCCLLFLKNLEKFIIVITPPTHPLCITINLFHLSTGLNNETLNLDIKNIYETQERFLTKKNLFSSRFLGITRKITFILKKKDLTSGSDKDCGILLQKVNKRESLN